MVVSLGLVAEEKTDGALEWSVSPGARLANAAHFQDNSIYKNSAMSLPRGTRGEE
jgi:hypothetical protein